MPMIMRPPPAIASMVIACMPSIAGGRPASCTTAVPSLMRSVRASDRGERGERVGAVGLGRPHRVEAELLGALHEVVRHLHRRGAVELQSQSELQHEGDARRKGQTPSPCPRRRAPTPGTMTAATSAGHPSGPEPKRGPSGCTTRPESGAAPSHDGHARTRDRRRCAAPLRDHLDPTRRSPGSAAPARARARPRHRGRRRRRGRRRVRDAPPHRLHARACSSASCR